MCVERARNLFRNWKGRYEVYRDSDFKPGDFCWFWNEPDRSDLIAGPFDRKDDTPTFEEIKQHPVYFCKSLRGKRFKNCRIVRGGLQGDFVRMAKKRGAF